MSFAAQKNTVLVVDDDAEVREYVRTVLLRQGYEVLEAEDGVQAYELLRRLSGGIQLLVTDVEMPRMDGITLGHKVSADYPNIEVLYISGFVTKPPKHVPSSHFLLKPFRPDVLVRHARSLCA
jgi:CheY-like chemotaxis protein